VAHLARVNRAGQRLRAEAAHRDREQQEEGMSTQKAKELLEAYRGRCPCVFPSECDTCRAQIQADLTLGEKREPTLAVAIKLADELWKVHTQLGGHGKACLGCQALAEWKAL
jgi:hypothetical protein